jgi:predicted NAD/FAD-dependent oxidoreductase
MNRRKFAKLSASAAATIPALTLLNRVSLAQNNTTGVVLPWGTSATITSLTKTLTTTFNTVNNSGVTALTADEWDTAASQLDALACEHGRLGNTHKFDCLVLENPAWCRTQIGTAKSSVVDYMIDQGSHPCMYQATLAMQAVATKLRSNVVPANVCSWAFAAWSFDMDALLASAFGFEEFSPFFAVAGLGIGAVALFAC